VNNSVFETDGVKFRRIWTEYQRETGRSLPDVPFAFEELRRGVSRSDLISEVINGLLEVDDKDLPFKLAPVINGFILEIATALRQSRSTIDRRVGLICTLIDHDLKKHREDVGTGGEDDGKDTQGS